ncbi:MAG: hypothetical protein LBE46_02120, partial [Wolbachia pipientis]|nr:hypothetical protein [Wolbachia pipientis]
SCLTLKQTFLIKLHRSWIPVSGHWDDTPLVAQTTTFVQLCAVSQLLTRSGMLANLRSLAN